VSARSLRSLNEKFAPGNPGLEPDVFSVLSDRWVSGLVYEGRIAANNSSMSSTNALGGQSQQHHPASRRCHG